MGNMMLNVLDAFPNVTVFEEAFLMECNLGGKVTANFVSNYLLDDVEDSISDSYWVEVLRVTVKSRLLDHCE